jgi:CBS domain-containing protein
MLVPLSKLLKDRREPLAIRQDAKISDALQLMMKNDYSQLPVVDEAGCLVGIISEQGIVQRYFHLNAAVSLLDLAVSHCMTTPPVTATPEADISHALGLLNDAPAVVLVQDGRPHRILTTYDTTHFFYSLARSLILLENIELRIRKYTDGVLPTDSSLKAALMRAFKPDRRDPTQPAKSYNELTLREYVQLIVTDGNWAKFEPYLAPKLYFTQLMEQVIPIRNQQMHFRGELDHVQHNALSHALAWLETRPNLPVRTPQVVVHVDPQTQPRRRTGGKYSSLLDWLENQRTTGNRIVVSFNDVENVLGEPLPASALEHRSWWANDATSHSQSRAWMQAGWKVHDVDFRSKAVVFRQSSSAKHQLFFSDLLERLSEHRPSLTRAAKVLPEKWLAIDAGKPGFSFSWVFYKDNHLRVDLFIDTDNSQRTKMAYDLLLAQKAEIEREFGEELGWHRLDHRSACRITATYRMRVDDDPEHLELAKQWAFNTGLNLIDTLQPRIRTLPIV